MSAEHPWSLTASERILESQWLSVLREVAEDAGHRIQRLEHLAGFYASYGCGNQRYEVFLAEDPQPLDVAPDPNEVMETRWFAREDVLGMLLRDEIPDALSLAPLMKLCLRDAA